MVRASLEVNTKVATERLFEGPVSQNFIIFGEEVIGGLSIQFHLEPISAPPPPRTGKSTSYKSHEELMKYPIEAPLTEQKGGYSSKSH